MSDQHGQDRYRYSAVWYGMIWLKWQHMVWQVLQGVVWFGAVWQGLVEYGQDGHRKPHLRPLLVLNSVQLQDYSIVVFAFAEARYQDRRHT